MAVVQLLLGAAERERSVVAGVLRSDTAQILTTALIGLTAVAQESASTEARESLEALRSELRSAVERLQVLATLVRPSVLEDFGLVAAVRAIGDCLSSEHGVRIAVEDTGSGMRLDFQDEALIYRILEEAVRNAVIHSGADRVLVSIVETPQDLELTVEDDGCGFDSSSDSVSAGKTSGLLLMNARTRALNGWLNIQSSPEAGTRVSLRVPLNGAAS